MNSERITEAGSPEEIFLARLADVAPVAEATEQVHLTAALAAVREAEVAATGRRTALRPTVPLWRKPRMALSNIAAIIAGLSLPMKAAAASTVAVAAIGGAAVTGNLPTQAENANDGLSNATEQTGFDEQLPAHGQPAPLPAGEGDDVEAQEHEGQEHENKGIDETVRAANPEDRGEAASAAGQAKAAEASDGRSAEARAAAAEKRAEAEARAAAAQERQEAQARQEAAAERRAEADARADAERVDGETRGQQARDNATTDESDTETDATSDDAAGDASTGAGASSGGRAKAGAASGR